MLECALYDFRAGELCRVDGATIDFAAAWLQLWILSSGTFDVCYLGTILGMLLPFSS